jgi:hypothetical protein
LQSCIKISKFELFPKASFGTSNEMKHIHCLHASKTWIYPKSTFGIFNCFKCTYRFNSLSALNNHIYSNHAPELFTKKPQEAPLEPIAAKELKNTSPILNSVEFSTKSFKLHMKIIPKASFGNSYALIDSNLLKI